MQQIFNIKPRMWIAIQANSLAGIARTAFGIGATMLCTSGFCADVYQLMRRDRSESFSTDASDKTAVLASRTEREPVTKIRAMPKGRNAMQLMPATAQRYGVSDRTDPIQNIDTGVRYLKDLLRSHNYFFFYFFAKSTRSITLRDR